MINPAQLSKLPPLIHDAETAPAYWFLGILWIVLIDGEQTEGRYSLMEQLMPQDVGTAPHVHPFNDEGFYAIDGSMEMTVGDLEEIRFAVRTVSATQGTSVWILRKTIHAFKVTSPRCRVLDSFARAGMEQPIESLARPTECRELPPKN